MLCLMSRELRDFDVTTVVLFSANLRYVGLQVLQSFALTARTVVWPIFSVSAADHLLTMNALLYLDEQLTNGLYILQLTTARRN